MEKYVKNPGKLIRGTLIRMLPGAYSSSFLICIMFLIDSMLAGRLIGPEAISSAAIAMPCYGFLVAVSAAVMRGTSLQITWAKGRADHERFERFFNGGLVLSVEIGIIFGLILFIFAHPIVMLFGGANTSEEIVALALLYLRWYAPAMFLTCVNGLLGDCISAMGYQMERTVMTLVNIVTNIGASYLFVTILPDDVRIAGLGIGSAVATLIQIIISIFIIRIRKIDVRFRPVFLKIREILDILRCGIPGALDNVIDSLMAAVINNVILTGFPDEPLFLSVVSVVANIKNMVRSNMNGMSMAAEPLFGIFYAERDKSSLKRTMTEAIIVGLPAVIIWDVIIWIALPLLTGLYGMELTPDIRQGVLFLLIFTPFTLITFLLISFYESTERFISSLAFAIIPDSVLYPLMLMIMIPGMGKTGVWLSLGIESLAGLIILIPVMLLLSRNNPTFSDRVLRLKPHILERSPCFKFVIESSEESAVGISEHLQNFLLENGSTPRIANLAALCTEELAVDMVSNLRAHSRKVTEKWRVLDIRVFQDDDTVEILIRTMGKPYDPLDTASTEDPVAKLGVRMVQKIAESVTYTYVYKLNIVSIVLNGRM